MRVHIAGQHGSRLVYDSAYAGMKSRMVRGVQHPEPGTEIVMPKRGAYILVKRDRYKTLPVTVRKGTVEKTVQVKPVISGTYISNLSHAFPLLAFGFLVDRNNPNRFGYPAKIYVDPRSSNDRPYYFNRPLRRMAQPEKLPYLDLDFSPPLANIFSYYPGEIEASTGLLGATLALNLHYRRYRFLSLEYSYNSFPGLSPGERLFSNGDTIHERKQQGWAIAIKHNHVLKRIELGYGLAVWAHTGSKSYSIYPRGPEYRTYFKHDVGIAFATSAYYQFRDYMAAGFTYQPQLISFDGGAGFNYAYTWSMGVKLRLSPLFR